MRPRSNPEDALAGLKTPSVPALDRALIMLDLLAASGSGLSLSTLARRLALPKSSTHCLLLTLERHGYLHRNQETRRYMLGRKLFGLANLALSGLQLREQTAPFLRALMTRTHLTVHMAILEHNEAVLIEKVEPPGLLRLATWLGKRMEVHCTGVGKALIAYVPDEELVLLFRKHGLPRHNENTIVSLRRLRENLTEIRRVGYALDDEEDELGHRCVGCPVFDHTGRVSVAISVSGTTVQIPDENVPALATEVMKAAAAVSRSLGFPADDVQP
jgi:DNA-binding IclR family transcriptional regulator